MQKINYEIDNLQDAIDFVIEMVDDEGFRKCLRIVDDIIENPEKYSGPQAQMNALKIAGYRSKMGVAMEYWTIKKVTTQKPDDKLINSALRCLFNSLEEVINCLKLRARFEGNLLGHG